MNYRDDLRDTRWQKLRLQILERDNWQCQARNCRNRSNPRVMLVVHHLRYIPGGKAWESPPENLVTVCQKCHDRLHITEPDPVPSDLVPNRFFAWHEISRLIGYEPYGYLTAVRDQIGCGCFRMDLNPDAPDIILPGRSNPQWVAKARILLKQATPIPVFLKVEGLPWEYRGNYQATRLTQEEGEIARHSKPYRLDDVGAVLFLEKA